LTRSAPRDRREGSSAACSGAVGFGQRLGRGLFGRLADVLVDRLADDALRELIEVSVELLGQREELGPERAVLEDLRRADDDRTVAPSALAERPKPVAPAESDEELSLPGIG
jgi:hypothetical protein